MAEDATPETDIVPFAAKERTLANGLRVIAVPTGFPNLVSLQIPVQTGSRNEVEPGKSGFAHFFEHMMFRGTKRYPPHEYNAILTRVGARQNAYTTDDYTNYHITFAAEDLETIVEIEADRFMNLDYSEADFRTEAKAILGEYNKSASDPTNKLLEVQRDSAYQVHPYKHTTMGFIADIEAMPDQYEYSRVFFDRWYRPGNTAVLLAGDIDPDRAIDLVEKHWGAWQPGTAAPIAIPQEPLPASPVVVHVPWDSATLPWVTVGFHGPAFSVEDPAHAAVDVLLDLQFGETSDAYQDLVERRQLVDQLFVYGGGTTDPGLFTIFARLKQPDDAITVRDTILAAVDVSRARPLDSQRVADAKSNLRYAFARTLDNSESIGATLARFVRHERRYDTLNQLYRTYAALTAEDLHRAAQTYLTRERLVLTTLSHDALPAGIADLPTAASAGTASPAAVPEVLVPSPSPLVRFKLLFGVGSAHDPAGREGLATLAAAMLTEAGSTAMRIDEINRALFPMAGSLSAQVDREMTVFSGVAHRDTVDAFLDIVLPQLLSPGYRDDDFERLRETQRNALTQDLRASNEEEFGKELLQAEVFAGTPYGHAALGTVAALDTVTLDDVKAFVAANFTAANATLGLTGDIPEPALERLRAAAASLPPGQRAAEPSVVGRRTNGMSITIVEKDTRSAAISLGHSLGVTRSHPDFPALFLAKAWLGEHRSTPGQLFQRLREVRGLNYGNYAYIEAFPGGMYKFFPDANRARRAQLFEIWIRPVVPAHAVFALKAGVFELRQLIERGLTPEQFESTRQYLMKSVYQFTKTQDQQLGYALDSRWHGTGEFVAAMRAGWERLAVEDVNAAIRRHLSGHDLHTVIIAKDAAALKAELESRAFTEMRYEVPMADDVLAEDRVIGALDLGLTDVRIVPVDDVFAR